MGFPPLQFLLWPATQADPAAAEAALVAYSAAAYGPWKQQYDKSRGTVTRTSYEASTYSCRTVDARAARSPINLSWHALCGQIVAP